MAKRNTTGLPKKQKMGQTPNATPTDGETPEGAAAGGESLIQQLQDSTQDPEKFQKLIVRGVIGLVVIIVLLIGIGVIWESIIVPGQTVAVVNGQSITVGDFQERVSVERAVINQRFNIDLGILVRLGQDPNAILQQEPYTTWWSEITQQPELLGSRVLNDMINETIVRAEAESLGVVADEAEVDAEIDSFFNFIREDLSDAVEAGADGEEEPEPTLVPTETPTPFVSPTPSSTPRPTEPPTSTPTPEATEAPAEGEDGAVTISTPTPRPTSTPQPTRTFEELEAEYDTVVEAFYADANSRANLSRDAVRSYFEYRALLTALRDEVTADVARETTYVNTRHILVGTEEEAQDVIAALDAGESFADIARAVSTDTGSGARGGELGWAPASNFVPEFEAATLESEIGTITEPVQSQFGYHIIQVLDREEREMTDEEYERARDNAFNEWFNDLVSAENNDITRNDNWPSHIPDEPTFVYNPIGVAAEN